MHVASIIPYHVILYHGFVRCVIVWLLVKFMRVVNSHQIMGSTYIFCGYIIWRLGSDMPKVVCLILGLPGVFWDGWFVLVPRVGVPLGVLIGASWLGVFPMVCPVGLGYKEKCLVYLVGVLRFQVG